MISSTTDQLVRARSGQLALSWTREQFRRYFRDVHGPVAMAIPGGAGASLGAPGGFHRLAVVEPELDDDIPGGIRDRAKAELLGGATALPFPIDWPEPFGLVMIEARACGTPVIARRRGSVPEVLRDGVTGFLCETETEMVDAIARLPEISRRRCREEFEARFSDRVMAMRYLDVYQRLLGHRAAAHVDIDKISNVETPASRFAQLRAGSPASDRESSP